MKYLKYGLLATYIMLVIINAGTILLWLFDRSFAITAWQFIAFSAMCGWICAAANLLAQGD